MSKEICRFCGTEALKVCKKCLACGRCERCRNRQGWQSDIPALTGVQEYNILPRALGMECELGSSGLSFLRQFHPKIAVWKWTSDGSVNSGTELIVKAAAGDAFFKGAIETAEAFHAAGATTDESCGFHVHVNGLDLSVWDIRRLLLLWRNLEDEIFGLVEPRRQLNRFCRPCTETINTNVPALKKAKTSSELKAALIQAMYGLDINKPKKVWKWEPDLCFGYIYICTGCLSAEHTRGGTHMVNPYYYKGTHTTASHDDIRKAVKDGKLEPFYNNFSVNPKFVAQYKALISSALPSASDDLRQYQSYISGKYGSESRYWALNIHSWLYRGSIEFRLHHGTVALDDLVCWPLFCGWMVEAASRFPDFQIEKISTIEEMLALEKHGKQIFPAYLQTYIRNKRGGSN